MKKFRLILVVALLLGGMLTVSAQQRDHHGISVQLGGILPLQDFSASQSYVLPLSLQYVPDVSFQHL